MRQHGRYELGSARRQAVLEHITAAVDAPQILIVDDHALIRCGLALLIRQRYPDAMILEAGSLAEALDRIRASGSLSAVLYDLYLDDSDGLPGVETMLAALDDVPLLLISGSIDTGLIAACIRAGARGFLPKGAEPAVLDHALPIVLGGGIYAPLPGPLSSMSNTVARRSISVAPPRPAPLPDGIDKLTERQREVLRLLLEGRSNKEIARSLGVLEGTIKVHMRSVMQRLGVRNRTQLALVAVKSGLVTEVERLS